MNSPSAVRLLEAEPDLGRSLSESERALAEKVVVPARTLPAGDVDVAYLLSESEGFAAMVLDQILLRRVWLGERGALAVLGPGDVIWPPASVRPAMLVSDSFRAPGPLGMAILDDHFLGALQRVPRLAAALQARQAEQQERLAAQLVICQLSHVEDRVFSMLWLLAETWGRVTKLGTKLPVSLTHDTLGALVGARRPTVSLALKALSDRGALIRHPEGWLLLESPALPHEPPAWEETAELTQEPARPWVAAPGEPGSEWTPSDEYAGVRATYLRNARIYRRQFETSKASREQSQMLREMTESRRIRRQAPS